MTWQQFATAALGVTAMIAGGFLMTTPAGAPLIAAGGTLVGFAIPWPAPRRWRGDSEPPKRLADTPRETPTSKRQA